MDDSSYQEALRRREELRRQLDDVEEFIRLYERLFPDRVATRAADASESEHQIDPGEPVGQRSRNSVRPRQIASMARDEILARGRPMTRGELVKALEDRGVELAAVDKAKNVGTILWRFRHEFENIPGRGYWPKDTPLDGRLF